MATKSSNHLTNKQVQLMTVITKAVDGIDADALLDRLTYETTKQSLKFSFRALEGRNLISRNIEKRRGRRRAIYRATSFGMATMGAGLIPTASRVTVSVEEDDLETALE